MFRIISRPTFLTTLALIASDPTLSSDRMDHFDQPGDAIDDGLDWATPEELGKPTSCSIFASRMGTRQEPVPPKLEFAP